MRYSLWLLGAMPLFLQADSVILDRVEVNAADSQNGGSVYIEKEGYMKAAPMQKRLTTEEALQVAGTNGDPVKALKSFAGVVSTNNDDGSELYIHGSKPRETRFTINHLPIGYLFHLGGLHSVIAPEMTGQIDAYLGGFDVSYGAMGAVVDITPKYPSGSGEGRLHLGMYDADFAYDGKISENTNFFISARRSYFDFIADDILDELDKDDDDESKKTTFTLFPQFYDGQFILSHNVGDHALSLEAMIAKDQMKLNDTMEKDKDPVAVGKINTEIESNTIGARWMYYGENITSNTLLYRMYVKQDVDLFDADYFVDTSTTEFGLYHESVFDVEDHKPMVGFEVVEVKAPLKARITSPEFADFDGPITDKDVVVVDKTFKAKNYTLFVQDIWDITPDNHFRYGLRAWDTDFQAFGSGVDPRVAFVHDVSEDLSLSVAIGKYSQLPETIYVIEGFGNPKIDTFEFSNHYTVSVQKTFDDDSSLSVEPYYKTFENLAITDEAFNYDSVGEGKAYGIDITYKKRIANFDIIAAYTFVKAKRALNTESKKQYRFEGDIPHTFQLNTNYRLDNGWRVSGFFKYNDGAPYTPVIGTEDYQYEGKTYKRPIYGEPYSKRLPYNVDLDIQIGKTIKYANKKSLEFSIELMNITSVLRKNVAGIEYNDAYEKDGEYYQMGFLPAFHVNYRF
ncbi:MAG: TonB-dependent receptor plug domain-containing protein [Epsilonproteobacteria bacterium]|nr:TonB-dependent receptor plug domain-containing protein [Campylobacterota bacterium]